MGLLICFYFVCRDFFCPEFSDSWPFFLSCGSESINDDWFGNMTLCKPDLVCRSSRTATKHTVLFFSLLSIFILNIIHLPLSLCSIQCLRKCFFRQWWERVVPSPPHPCLWDLVSAWRMSHVSSARLPSLYAGGRSRERSCEVVFLLEIEICFW